MGSKTLEIGKLNKRLTFLTLKEVEDELGQSRQVLSKEKTLWGDLYGIRGAEYYEAQKIRSEQTSKAYIRYRKDWKPTEDHLILCEGEIYSIKSAIDVDGSHVWWEIYCAKYEHKEEIEIE